VIAVGKSIGRKGTNGKIVAETNGTAATGPKKQRRLHTIDNVPAKSRAKITKIRNNYKKWGAQKKNSVAGSSIIAACNKNKALINIVMATMLRNKTHTELRNSIRKQIQASL